MDSNRESGRHKEAASRSGGELRALTSCRGIAALTVAIYHVLYAYYSYHGTGLHSEIGRGYLCVDFFFVLSGFVIAYAYRGYFLDGASLVRYRTFLIRRIGRTYPLYVSILTFLIVETLLVYGNFRGRGPLALESHYPVPVAIANYLLVFDWGLKIHGFVGASWSISTEFAAYIVFPLFVSVCFARSAWIRAAALATSLATLAALCATEPSLDLYAGVPSLLRCFAEFCLGIFAFRLYNGGNIWSERISRDAVILVIVGMGAAALALRSDLAVVLCFPPFVAAVAGNRGRCMAVLETPVLHRLGLISYSIYLVHPLLQTSVLVAAPALQSFGFGETAAVGIATIVIVLVILALSHLTYRFIEEPGRHTFRRLGDAWAAASVLGGARSGATP